MRLISIDMLEPNMIVAKSIFNANSDILIKSGTVLNDIYISRLKALNFSGIYIDDELSQGIEIHDLIAEETRIKMMVSIQSLFLGMEKTDSGQVQKSLEAMVYSVIDRVISNRKNAINLLDIKNYDYYTYQHSINVSVLATVLGVALSMNRSELYALALSALFHDIGKTKVPIDILNKTDSLTNEEFELIKKHSVYGFQLAKRRLPMSIKAYRGILQHHEKYDGSGYPSGRAGKDIALFARIIAIADVYDAVTSRRPYHSPLPHSEAMEIIMASACIHFDPEIVNVFLKKVAIVKQVR